MVKLLIITLIIGGAIALILILMDYLVIKFYNKKKGRFSVKKISRDGSAILTHGEKKAIDFQIETVSDIPVPTINFFEGDSETVFEATLVYPSYFSLCSPELEAEIKFVDEEGRNLDELMKYFIKWINMTLQDSRPVSIMNSYGLSIIVRRRTDV